MTNFVNYLPPTVRFLIRYVLGFGVGVVVGLAPFLGSVKVRLFPNLLGLYPIQMQQYLPQLAAVLLGLVTVGLQYYSDKRRSAAILDRYFGWLLVILVAALLILAVLYTKFVIMVPVEATGGWVRVAIGSARSATCGCPPRLSDRECVKEVSIDPTAIDSCWENVQRVELALTISYLVSVSGFVTLVGLLLFKQLDQRRREPAPARAAARSKAKPRTGGRPSGKAPPPARTADRRR